MGWAEWLPSGASACSVQIAHRSDGRGQQCLQYNVWVPRGYDYIECEDRQNEGYEGFFQNVCRRCDYYRGGETFGVECDSDHDELPDWAQMVQIVVQSKCPCFEDGLDEVDFPCEAGHDDPDDSAEYGGDLVDEISPSMVFSLQRTFFHASWRESRYSRCDDQQSGSAYMQRILAVPSAGELRVNDRRQAFNVYDCGRICWGESSSPDSLAEMVAHYFDMNTNDDILKCHEFRDNASAVASEAPRRAVPAIGRLDEHGLLIKDGCFDAVMAAHPVITPDLYLLFGGCGFKPTPDGLIVVGLTAISNHQFVTEPCDAIGGLVLMFERGIASNPNLLTFVGQQANQPNPQPCSSPTTTSSAPAESVAG